MKALPHITVCICTCHRPRLLATLLARLAELRTDGCFTYSAVVVDNDGGKSAQDTVMAAQARVPYALAYLVEPERNISLARNRSVAAARGDLVAFIDDDEFPDPAWLLHHVGLLASSGADGVLGPVLPHFETAAPAWLVKSGLLDRRRFHTGERLTDARFTRTGNVLLRRSVFDSADGPFDARFGLSGGGDAVFFKRLMAHGKIFVWCDEALVYETVPPERQKRTYHIRRAFTRGMTEAWETPFLSRSTARSLLAVALYTASLPFSLLAGGHRFMRCLVKDCDHLGKILAHLGIQVVRRRPYSTP